MRTLLASTSSVPLRYVCRVVMWVPLCVARVAYELGLGWTMVGAYLAMS